MTKNSEAKVRESVKDDGAKYNNTGNKAISEILVCRTAKEY